MRNSRREFLKYGSTSAGALLLSGCGGGGTSAPAPAASLPTPSPPAATVSPEVAALQAYLRSKAVANLALPATTTAPPLVRWAGALSSASAATSLPGGTVYPVTHAAVGRILPSRWTASLPGDPRVDGHACYGVDRSYTCKGAARRIGSVAIFRLRTDAPVLELSGVCADGGGTAVTAMVDGNLVPTRTLSCSQGYGGWLVGTIQFDFGSRVLRDIWITTNFNAAYFKVAQTDQFLAIDDSADPQITVVGDSYQQAGSATFAAGGAIALELGVRLGIRKVAVDGIGGTGYWNSGGNLGNLNDRLAADAADNSTIYVVMAGINDYGDYIDPPQLVWPTRDTYEQAVLGYFSGLRAAQPKAVIVVTAPVCPVPSLSDSGYVVNAATNPTGTGDYLYKAALHKRAVQAIAGPWVYIDTLMGGGWLNSSGATGDITQLQWLTGGTAGPGTTATNKPGNTQGGGGGGFGGIAAIPVISGGRYTQAPDITATGGSGQGLLLNAFIDNTGILQQIGIVSPGAGYSAGAGLPTLRIDPAYQITPATTGSPQLMIGINPDGQYPLTAFAPAGATDLNNIYRFLMPDLTHPSPPGVEYLSTRLAKNIRDAVLAL